MGAKLIEFYTEARALGGVKAQMRLAILTMMPLVKAESVPDSDRNIRRFKEAISQIRKEA